MRRALAAVAAAALLAPACASPRTEPAMRLLGRAADRFGEVRRATIDLDVTMTAGQGRPVGFSVEGPVDLDRRPVPVADLTFTQLAGGTSKSVRIVADGRHVYAVSPSGTHRLPDGTLATSDVDGKLGEVRIERWLSSPRQSDGGTMDGVPVRRFDAAVDVAAALTDIRNLTRQVGQEAGGLGRLTDREIAMLRENVQAATMTVWAGRDDDLVRQLVLRLELGRPRSGLPAGIAALVPLRIDVRLALSRVGAPVAVPDVAGK